MKRQGLIKRGETLSLVLVEPWRTLRYRDLMKKKSHHILPRVYWQGRELQWHYELGDYVFREGKILKDEQSFDLFCP